MGELPQESWWGIVWFYKMGLLNNHALRSISIRFHARLHHCHQHVALMTEQLISCDRPFAVAAKLGALEDKHKTMKASDMNSYEVWAHQELHECLRDIDDL